MKLNDRLGLHTYIFFSSEEYWAVTEFKILSENCFTRYQNWNKSFKNKGKIPLKSWEKWRRNVMQPHMKQIWKDRKLSSLLVLQGKMNMIVFIYLPLSISVVSEFQYQKMFREAFAWESNLSTICVPIVFGLHLPHNPPIISSLRPR